MPNKTSIRWEICLWLVITPWYFHEYKIRKVKDRLRQTKQSKTKPKIFKGSLVQNDQKKHHFISCVSYSTDYSGNSVWTFFPTKFSKIVCVDLLYITQACEPLVTACVAWITALSIHVRDRMLTILSSPRNTVSETAPSSVSSVSHHHISSLSPEYAILGENWNVVWKYLTWNNLKEIILS